MKNTLEYLNVSVILLFLFKFLYNKLLCTKKKFYWITLQKFIHAILLVFYEEKKE